jgi:alanyl-tRNA synthetase
LVSRPKEQPSAGAESPLEAELKLEFFAREGFHRLTCESCRNRFWSLDPAARRCGDNPCVQYTFIGAPVTRSRFDLRGMREAFLTFFEARGHTRVAPYPVIARWRTDIYLTTASIADFQPHCTSGAVPPPANPLTISQPCVRLTDLDSVGRSGRHLTAFEMMAHHAFNRKGEGEIYWKERTVELCDEFLVKALGIPREAVTYKENPWFGGGNAGPALEVLAGGLEVATLVFMFLEEDPAGAVSLGGSTYRPMATRIVDTGYGLERFLWASAGSPNLYQALYPEVIDNLLSKADLGIDLKAPHTLEVLSAHARFAGMMSVDTHAKLRELRTAVAGSLEAAGVRTTVEELERLMVPLETAYAVADHTRTIPLLLTDGIVPSNVKAGYLARLLIRKTLRHLEALHLRAGDALLELVEMQGERLRRERDLPDRSPYIRRVLALETERYGQTVEKGKRMVKQLVEREKGAPITLEKLFELYNSQGIHPDLVREAAKAYGVKVEVPDAFLSMVAARAQGEKAPKPRPRAFSVAPTRLLYYEEPGPLAGARFEATVLWSQGSEVVLDRTGFFAESGGQPADHGTLEAGGQSWKVVDVQKEGDAAVHRLESGAIPRATKVAGRIDARRRMNHAVSHTATHITLAAAIQVLGPHVWQTGTQKSEREARIDITHFDRMTQEEVDAVERRADEIVLANHAVEAAFFPREEAEARFGIRIFQGGVPEGRMVRIVTIENTDWECCGGTHLKSTGQVGSIRIKRNERIADGVERLTYCGGLAAVEEGQRVRALLDRAAHVLSVAPDDLPKTAERFFGEWKERGKEIERLREELARAALKGPSAGDEVNGVRIVADRSALALPDLTAQAKGLARQSKAVGVFVSTADAKGPKVIITSTADVEIDCREILKLVLAAAGGGSGGGKPDFAQGGAPVQADPDRLLAAARVAIRKALGG